MGVFAPAALGLLSLLGVIIAFYMLRLRREEQRVPSIMLWEALAEDPPANAPWQRLRWSPLLILQLLALALLVLALARPWYWGNALSGEHLVLLVDRSASMAATDLGPSRLEVARETLLEMLDGAGDARVTLVAFDQEMEVLTSAEADRSKVEAALAVLRPAFTPGDADDALIFADSLARDRDETQIVVFSDGAFDHDPDLALVSTPRFVQIGEADDNQAITALSVEESADGLRLEGFLQVVNAGRRSADRRVEVWADGALVDARDVSLGPGERWSHTLALPASVERMEARLAGADAFVLDDRAWAIRARPAAIRVNLYSEGNRFLETAMGLLPGVASVRVVGAGADPMLVGRTVRSWMHAT